MSDPVRVLIVEDNAEARFSLRLLLEGWGCEVEEAADGLEGVLKAAARRPDAAVVDLDVPIYDGLGVARRLREEHGDAVRLIALTGLDQPERALGAGFDEHLLKPAEPERLRRALRIGSGGNATIVATTGGTVSTQHIHGGSFQGCQFGDRNSVENYFGEVDRLNAVPDDARQKLKQARQAIESGAFSDEDRRDLTEQLVNLTKEVHKPREERQPSLFKRYWDRIAAVAPTVATILSASVTLKNLLGGG